MKVSEIFWKDSFISHINHDYDQPVSTINKADVSTHQQKKRSEENPACFEVKQHFGAPGRTVADHVNDVLTKLIDS